MRALTGPFQKRARGRVHPGPFNMQALQGAPSNGSPQIIPHRLKLRWAVWILTSLCLGTNLLRAQNFQLHTTGARTGISARKSGETFYETDVYANWSLPWVLGWQTGLHLDPRIELSAGWLHGWHEDGLAANAGPMLSMGWKQMPVFLEGGFGPMFLSRDEFGPVDFGTRLQFMTYIGMTWECGSHLSLGYRYQHMSNARLADPNPGLNLHYLAIGWRF